MECFANQKEATAENQKIPRGLARPRAFGGLKSDTPESKHGIFVELSVREELDVSFVRVQQAQPKTSS